MVFEKTSFCCCRIGCDNSADYVIEDAPRGGIAQYENYTHVCKHCIGDLWLEGSILQPIDYVHSMCSITLRSKED
jgi:hypothetical protein